MTNRANLKDQLLKYLDVTPEQLEKTAGSNGLRLEFEHGITIEIHEPDEATCRLSTRICQLGQSMVTQEKQITRSLEILTEVLEDLGSGITLAVSDHDNCLRCLTEKANEAKSPEEAYDWMANFVDNAFAYKQTFLKFA